MKKILEILRGSNHVPPVLPVVHPKILKESPMFKIDFWRFYMKEAENGSTEFWAHSTSKEMYGRKELNVYIGKWHEKIITRADDFYQLEYHIQKGGERLFRIVQGMEDTRVHYY